MSDFVVFLLTHPIKRPFHFCFLVKPMFSQESLGTYTVVEGEPRTISLKAVGNPPEISYSWTIPELARPDLGGRIAQRGHKMVLESTRRTDSGNYTVTAGNSYGDFRTTANVYLDVLYPPE